MPTYKPPIVLLLKRRSIDKVVKSIPPITNRFAALDEKSHGQMEQSKGAGEVKHKFDQAHQLFLEQVFFDDPIHKSNRLKRDKPSRYK